MSQALNQLIEPSACLSRGQLMSYAQNKLIAEELYAVETHLNSCVLCSGAIDGILHHGLEAVEALAEMDGSFLKKHFEDIQPRIHLNSVAPTVHLQQHRKKEAFQFPVRTLASLTAAALAVAGVVWVLNKIAQAPAPMPVKVQKAAGKKELPAVKWQPEVSAATPAAPAQEPPSVPSSTAAIPLAADSIAPVVAKEAQPVTKPVAKPELPDTRPVTEEKSAPVKEEHQPALQPDSEKSAPAKKETKPEEKPAVPEKKEVLALPPGGSSFSQEQQFQHTINTYKKDLNSADEEKRNLARLVSAEAYRGLGQKEKATQLLEAIMEDGGPHKGEARRALRRMRREH